MNDLATTTIPSEGLGTLELGYRLWDGEALQSSREAPLGFDTETELIKDERQVPRLALAVASDGAQHVIIHPDNLGAFLLAHRDSFFVGHNVQFDFWVVDQHLAGTEEQEARRVLWDACHSGRLFDTMILDMLIQLANGQYRHVPSARAKSREERKVYQGNLGDVLRDYTTLQIEKEDPYRWRFGELLGLEIEQFADADEGFFQYAIADAAATHLLYPVLCQAAYELMLEQGFRRDAIRYEIRPDAIDRFGYLTEIVQVKASIVLAYMFRRGVHTDQAKVQALTQKYRDEITRLTEALLQDHPTLFRRKKDQTLKLTPKGQTPSWNEAELSATLERVAEAIRSSGNEITVPVSKGKKAGISKSAEDWAKYAKLHPFLELWTSFKHYSKLLEFLASLDHPILHCQYDLLKVTGRTSCARPRSDDLPGANLQQTPHAAEFRELFVPRSVGDKLFIADYSAIELRTLASVCRARFGESKLAEVIKDGVDPHAFTAAAIQGLPLQEFSKLKASDKTRFSTARQAAKAVNFGVPGGLGARTLRDYAELNYGVALTGEEAEAFRNKLINEIYPELNPCDGYLADRSMPLLAEKLGVTEEEVWTAFDRSGERSQIAARGVAKVLQGTSTAGPWYQCSVWDGLEEILNSAPDANRELAELIRKREGSQRLFDRIYRQSVASLTGRVRADVGYTDSKNTPFQALAADGAKLALWNILYAGFDVYGFVHDEILVNLPAENADEQAKQIEDILVKSMEEVLVDVPAACKWTVADSWSKPE